MEMVQVGELVHVSSFVTTVAPMPSHSVFCTLFFLAPAMQATAVLAIITIIICLSMVKGL